MIVLFGLESCDSCRTARRWLEDAGQRYQFVDLRAEPVGEETLARWIDAVGWPALLNRRSTTWRSLDPAERKGLDAERALGLMRNHPTLIKRPVTDVGGRILVGFDDSAKAALEAAKESA